MTQTAFRDYVDSIDQSIDSHGVDLPSQIAASLAALLEQRDWLPESCHASDIQSYRRHLLYADPAGRFTALALVWQPGQGTPIHGHTAWGAVGVYQGSLSADVYNYDEMNGPSVKCSAVCNPGEVCHVVAGTDEPHRIYNNSDSVSISIHTYGCDLVADPAGINILV